MLLAPSPAGLTLPGDHGRIETAEAVQQDAVADSLILNVGDGQVLPLLRYTQTDRGTPLVALIPLSVEGFDRLKAVERLLSSLNDRIVPPDSRLTHQQRARLRRMLQCFDGDRDGATQQEIAQVIFHAGRLTRDEWQASSARHAVKSLLRDARAMIAGDYRKLLRHRRSS